MKIITIRDEIRDFLRCQKSLWNWDNVPDNPWKRARLIALNNLDPETCTEDEVKGQFPHFFGSPYCDGCDTKCESVVEVCSVSCREVEDLEVHLCPDCLTKAQSLLSEFQTSQSTESV